MTSILARLRQPFRAINAALPLPYVLNVIKLVAAVHLFTEHIGFLTRTEGPSMLPTLNVHGDWVYISRLYRRGKDIKVGDMVSIKHPMFPGFSAGKRVLGMPGDFVMFNGSGAGEDRMVQVSLGHLLSNLGSLKSDYIVDTRRPLLGRRRQSILVARFQRVWTYTPSSSQGKDCCKGLAVFGKEVA